MTKMTYVKVKSSFYSHTRMNPTEKAGRLNSNFGDLSESEIKNLIF